MNSRIYKSYFKRFFDIIISFIVLVVIFPILLIVSLLIKITSKGPVFYLQSRVGRYGKDFNIYKFRTMTDENRDPMKQQTFLYDPEITSIGRFLRRFKIDELPQIINVFVGDMSLVGPRPALRGTYEIYGDIANQRLLVRPGMTGLSQINGNIYLTWEERFMLDAKYIENISFVNDLFIIFKTVGVVFLGEKKYLKK